MKVVANIAVRDEIELIQIAIEHHLSIGIDAFVITDICSTDGTRDVLQQYQSDSRFHILFKDSQDIRDFNWYNEMVQVSRTKFDADFICNFDADEFWLPYGGDIKIFADNLKNNFTLVDRYNAIFRAESAPVRIFPGVESVGDQLVIGRPIRNSRRLCEGKARLPFVLGQIGKKGIVRAKAVLDYGPGAHTAIGPNYRRLRSAHARNALVVHFPFTSLDRYLRKVRNVSTFAHLIRERLPPGSAWQWFRWIGLQKKADAPIILNEEFDHQFPSDAAFRSMLVRGTIKRASSLLEACA